MFTMRNYTFSLKRTSKALTFLISCIIKVSDPVMMHVLKVSLILGWIS